MTDSDHHGREDRSARAPVRESPAAPLGGLRRQLERNYLPLAVGAAVVLLAVAGAGWLAQQRRGRAARASQMLLAAQTPKQWEALLADYPGTPAAPIARLALASARYQEGAVDQAEAEYGRFLDLYPKHAMVPGAELGKVQCQEARGAVEEALNGYSLFLIAHPGHFLEPQALFGKARCLQLMGRLPEARAIYEEYIAAHPQGDWTPQAEFALRALERQVRARPAAPAANTAIGMPALPIPAAPPAATAVTAAPPPAAATAAAAAPPAVPIPELPTPLR